MSLSISNEFSTWFYSEDELNKYSAKVCDSLRKIKEIKNDETNFAGWYSLLENYDMPEYMRIKKCAEKIRKSCDVFVVIGVGGSYLGARCAIEFCQGLFHNTLNDSRPEIYFVGVNADSDYISDILSLCEKKDVCVNVISKSGSTTEPAVAFRIFKKLLEDKYGKKEAAERIFVTTDKEVKKGTLMELAVNEGYETFVIPRNIGGRYSVLTPVGILPMAVAGIDTDAVLNGAKKAIEAYSVEDFDNNPVLFYAAMRNLFYEKGKKFEVFASFSARNELLGEWLKQLFGESEGKEEKGIFPISAIYTRDLHSLGQYIQEGERTMFETFIEYKKPLCEIKVPSLDANVDGLKYLEGKNLDFVNKKAYLGTCEAHKDGKVPSLTVLLDKADEENFGYLVIFFELSCAVSGYTLGVNPFNQPGVEAYKKNMFRLLGNPGYTK